MCHTRITYAISHHTHTPFIHRYVLAGSMGHDSWIPVNAPPPPQFDPMSQQGLLGGGGERMERDREPVSCHTPSTHYISYTIHHTTCTIQFPGSGRKLASGGGGGGG
ncbi:hypothetical protein EON63_15590, partial [archaeon]